MESEDKDMKYRVGDWEFEKYKETLDIVFNINQVIKRQ